MKKAWSSLGEPYIEMGKFISEIDGYVQSYVNSMRELIVNKVMNQGRDSPDSLVDLVQAICDAIVRQLCVVVSYPELCRNLQRVMGAYYEATLKWLVLNNRTSMENYNDDNLGGVNKSDDIKIEFVPTHIQAMGYKTVIDILNVNKEYYD